MLDNVDKYVLKPQREGGGNNYYNKQIRLDFRCSLSCFVVVFVVAIDHLMCSFWLANHIARY